MFYFKKYIHKQTVDVHIQFDFLNEHLYLSGVWLGADPRTDIMKRCVPKVWTTCSKYDNHSRFNSKHNRGNLYNRFNDVENLHLNNECDIHTSSKDHEECDYIHQFGFA